MQLCKGLKYVLVASCIRDALPDKRCLKKKARSWVSTTEGQGSIKKLFICNIIVDNKWSIVCMYVITSTVCRASTGYFLDPFGFSFIPQIQSTIIIPLVEY